MMLSSLVSEIDKHLLLTSLTLIFLCLTMKIKWIGNIYRYGVLDHSRTPILWVYQLATGVHLLSDFSFAEFLKAGGGQTFEGKITKHVQPFIQWMISACYLCGKWTATRYFSFPDPIQWSGRKQMFFLTCGVSACHDYRQVNSHFSQVPKRPGGTYCNSTNWTIVQFLSCIFIR